LFVGVFGVQGALKFDHGDCGVLDELNFADPALMLILAQLVVYLFEKEVTAVVYGRLLMALRIVAAHTSVGVLVIATEMV
jgi:hypothetical protein